MGEGAAGPGGRLTAEQRDEVFLYRWLFGLSFRDLDELPEWERDVLTDRINVWLPRILGVGDSDGASSANHAQPVQAAGLPLADFGIAETLIDRTG